MPNFCDTCGHQYSDVCGVCETLDGVPVKYSEKKKTNADVIRAMTDEELAKFIQEDVFAEPWCPDDVPYVLGSGCQLIDKDCGKCALKWLKQEVEE